MARALASTQGQQSVPSVYVFGDMSLPREKAAEAVQEMVKCDEISQLAVEGVGTSQRQQ